MNNFLPDVLISEEDIALRVADLGKAITADFSDEELVVVSVLKGAFIFTSDLIKKIRLPLKLEFITCSSYGDTKLSNSNVKIDMSLTESIENKNILIVEDIIDSGHTIDILIKELLLRKPKSIKVASLLLKPDRLKTKIKIDYLGFEVEDKFVVGYGLDYAGRYRELPFIGVLNAGN